MIEIMLRHTSDLCARTTDDDLTESPDLVADRDRRVLRSVWMHTISLFERCRGRRVDGPRPFIAAASRI
jgi:hypothetical protein